MIYLSFYHIQNYLLVFFLLLLFLFWLLFFSDINNTSNFKFTKILYPQSQEIFNYIVKNKKKIYNKDENRKNEYNRMNIFQ
mgnify:CR=1 FL=1